MIYPGKNSYYLEFFHGTILRFQIYNKMSSFVLLILSFLCTVFVESFESDPRNVIKLIEESKCGLSNENFILALQLRDFCSQSLLQPDKYRNKLNYDSTPLLCTEYYLVNSYICTLSRDGKNVSIPNDKVGVDRLMINLRSKFNNVDEFCNITQKEVPKFSHLQKSELIEVDQIFKGIMVNKTMCKGLCSKRFDDGVTDLCNIIIWAWSETEVTAAVTEGIVDPPPDESHIEKISPKNYAVEEEKKIFNQEKVEFGQPETLNEKPDRIESNQGTIFNDMNQNISGKAETGVNAAEQQNSITNNHSRISDVQIHGIVEQGEQINKNDVNKNVLKLPSAKISNTDINAPVTSDGSLPKISQDIDNHKEQVKNKDNINTAEAKETLNGSENNNNFNEGEDNIDLPPIDEMENNDKPDGHDTPSVDPENEPVDITNTKPETDEQQEDILMENEKLPQTQGESNIGDLHRYERLEANEDTHFFTYFVSMGVVCGVMYILFHNKKKILALAVEGRRGRPHGGGRRRPNTAAYSKLDSNLEEAMVSNVSQASVTHVLY